MWWNSDDYLKPSDSILQSFFSLKMQLTLRIWTGSQRKLNISVPSLILGQYFSSYLLADDSRETQIKWLRLRLPRDDKTKNLGLLPDNFKSLLQVQDEEFDLWAWHHRKSLTLHSIHKFSLIELLSETKMFLSLMHSLHLVDVLLFSCSSSFVWNVIVTGCILIIIKKSEVHLFFLTVDYL